MGVPGLEDAALSTRVLGANYLFIDTHDILLDMSSAGTCPPLSSTMEVGGEVGVRAAAKVAFTRAAPASLVKDIARMVVLDSFEQTTPPSVRGALVANFAWLEIHGNISCWKS